MLDSLSSLTLISLTLRSPDSRKFYIVVSEAFVTARRLMSCVLRVESIWGLVLLRLEGSQQLTRSGSVTGSALGGEWMATDDVRVFLFSVEEWWRWVRILPMVADVFVASWNVSCCEVTHSLDKGAWVCPCTHDVNDTTAGKLRIMIWRFCCYGA